MIRRIAVIVGAIGMASAANAVNVSFTLGATGFQVGDNQIANFDTTFGGAALTGSGTGYYTGTQAVAAAPMNDASQYLAVLSGGSASFSFINGFNKISFDVGSVDDYNSLTLTLLGANPVTLSGSQIINGLAATGDQHSAINNGRLTLTADAGHAFTGLSLASSGNSFEVDNLAVSGAVPEPATWAMMLVGFGGMGYAMRSSRKVAVRFS